MVSRAQKIRVFIFIGSILLLLGYTAFLLVGRKLLEQNDTYFIRLKKQSVTGLSVGQDVRYYGINIGKITDISINRDDISEIIVEVSIKSGTPIKKSTTAELNFLGITGLKIIELSGGENDDEDLEPLGFIKSKKGVISDITGKAEVITEKVELLLNNIIELTSSDNRESISNILESSSTLVSRIDSISSGINMLLSKNRGDINSIVRSSRSLTDSLMVTIGNINRVIIGMDSTINSSSTVAIIENLSNSVRALNSKLLPEIEEVISKSSLAVTHIDKTITRSRKNFIDSMESLKEMLENFNEFSRLIRDNPDILLKGRE
ncbi:MAG: hypothetical protein CR982_08360 [Candidatus Cloacimonadota bacterium]|nr:MAG: hypothetical protein CR982_08360 [Candidatus Cloacimonadota bacterium]PIE79064.1 MAG: hypothetical protein CSA15_04805 [Candidatus Delongbacteria bacterium]